MSRYRVTLGHPDRKPDPFIPTLGEIIIALLVVLVATRIYEWLS